MKRYVARFGILTLIAVLPTTEWFANSGAKGQQQERIVVRKPWRVEPVRVVAVKTKNKETKENIETHRAFDEDDDWLDGFTITIANNYDKTVTALTIAMVFRREPGDSRPPFAYNLRFGPSPNIREYLNRDPSKVVKVGKTLDLHFNSESYQLIKRSLERLGYPSSIKRVELVIREVGFEDGSMIHTGTLYLQDPNYPNDPTRKIPVRQPRAQKQKPRSPPDARNMTGISFSKASFKPSFTLPNSTRISFLPKVTQDEDCMAKDEPNTHNCGISLN